MPVHRIKYLTETVKLSSVFRFFSKLILPEFFRWMRWTVGRKVIPSISSSIVFCFDWNSSSPTCVSPISIFLFIPNYFSLYICLRRCPSCSSSTSNFYLSHVFTNSFSESDTLWWLPLDWTYVSLSSRFSSFECELFFSASPHIRFHFLSLCLSLFHLNNTFIFSNFFWISDMDSEDNPSTASRRPTIRTIIKETIILAKLLPNRIEYIDFTRRPNVSYNTQNLHYFSLVQNGVSFRSKIILNHVYNTMTYYSHIPRLNGENFDFLVKYLGEESSKVSCLSVCLNVCPDVCESGFFWLNFWPGFFICAFECVYYVLADLQNLDLPGFKNVHNFFKFFLNL